MVTQFFNFKLQRQLCLLYVRRIWICLCETGLLYLSNSLGSTKCNKRNNNYLITRFELNYERKHKYEVYSLKKRHDLRNFPIESNKLSYYATEENSFTHPTLENMDDVSLSDVTIHPGAIIMQSNISWYCMECNNDWRRTYIRVYIHKRHPISHPQGWVIGCLL